MRGPGGRCRRNDHVKRQNKDACSYFLKLMSSWEEYMACCPLISGEDHLQSGLPKPDTSVGGILLTASLTGNHS